MKELIGDYTREEFNFNARSNRGWVRYLTMSFPEVFCDRGDGKVSYNVLNELNEVLGFAEENAYNRAYDDTNITPFLWTFLSGKNGYVSQVIDFGCGFDAEEAVRATVTHQREHGVHFQRHGYGLDTFYRARLHLVGIDSSSQGTSVNVLHEY